MKKLLIAFFLLSAFGFAQTTCVNCGGGINANSTSNTIPKSAGATSNMVDSALSDSGTTISSTESMNFASGTAISWNSDTGISRDSAAVVDVGNGTAGNATGALRFNNGIMFGKYTTYNNKATAGYGVAGIYGATPQKAETTTADANVLTYTPNAAAGTYRVCTVISVSSATSGVISWTLSYTDSNGNAQANVAQQLFQQATAAPNTTFTTSAAGNYYGCAMIDVNNAAAAIVVKWVGGGTTAAKMSATVEQIQ